MSPIYLYLEYIHQRQRKLLLNLDRDVGLEHAHQGPVLVHGELEQVIIFSDWQDIHGLVLAL
jgi:hypothetical protein